jgi:hypothetical protein
VGPLGRLGEAIELAQTETLDRAILDIDLGDDNSFGVADTLEFRGVPFVFLERLRGNAHLAQAVRTQGYRRQALQRNRSRQCIEGCALKAAAQAT